MGDLRRVREAIDRVDAIPSDRGEPTLGENIVFELMEVTHSISTEVVK